MYHQGEPGTGASLDFWPNFPPMPLPYMEKRTSLVITRLTAPTFEN